MISEQIKIKADLLKKEINLDITRTNNKKKEFPEYILTNGIFAKVLQLCIYE